MDGDNADFWSLGNSGSLDSQFNPDSLEGGFFDGSLAMDTGADGEAPFAAPAPALFPAHPGPVAPRTAAQAFEAPLAAAMCVGPDSQALLNKVYDFQRQQRANLDKLRLAQVQILTRPAAAPLAALVEQQQRMLADTKAALQALVHAWYLGLLSPMEIWRWDFLWQDLQIQLTQLEVYLQEATGQPGPHVALAIINHPFPVVATKGRPMDGPPLCGQLLTGATVSVIMAAELHACPIIPPDTRGRLPPDLLDFASAPLDAESKSATLADLQFANGTRKQPIHLRLRLNVTLGGSGMQAAQQHQVESKPLPPTVGVTNEAQWEEAEGMLLERMVFVNGQAQPAPWTSLANHLQRHLVRGTKQDILNLQRIFSAFELSYFHRHWFGGQPNITLAQMRTWWQWYGKGMHRVRYTKHCLPLFLSGHLFGFIGKPEMERALSQQPPGAFLVRFSESNPGSFSVAYVHADGGVRHYLLSHEDLTTRKALPDFLYESAALTHFLRYQCRSGFNLAANPPQVQYVLEEKQHVLRPLLTKRETVHQTHGYDSELSRDPPPPSAAMAGTSGSFVSPAALGNADCWDAE